MVEVDYPHGDSTWPDTQQVIKGRMGPHSERRVASDVQPQRRRALPSSAARRGVAAGLIALALVFAACAKDDDAKSLSVDSDAPTGHITVSAAASLSRAFSEIVEQFTQSYGSNVSVDLNTGASSSLADAIVGGAPVDVFASADQANMTKLQDAKLVNGNPRTFAHNRLVIVVKPGNPKAIKSAADLRNAGTIALCSVEIPCGTYAAQALASAQVTIDESHVTRGQNVAATLDQVAEGDAVAAIVYVTDAMAKADVVDTVAIPDTQNVIAAYPIAALGPTKNAVSASFVEFVMGPKGQRILKKFGFLP